MPEKQNISSLELIRKVRGGQVGKTRREYLDFVVDGRSISEILEDDDSVSGIGWMTPAENEIAARKLLLEEPGELPDERRRILYGCGECCDISCGAVTMQIDIDGDLVTWSNFAYENNYEEIDFEGYEGIGPFVFRLEEYSKVLLNAIK